ncbi:hypothetical protein [Streptomyces sp. NPDC001568]|uniref:hypothetical protein n=1 Tax=Streptomyces sp. NPDC001568 TaxID=3364588 RepID=UPI0036C3F120
MTIDTSQVPATPVYTITLTESGVATLDGEEIVGAGHTPAQARIAALAEVRIKAAYHGRPVRVLAKEPNGSWPLIVAADGSVITLPGPHPAPPEPRPDAPRPAREVHPVDRDPVTAPPEVDRNPATAPPEVALPDEPRTHAPDWDAPFPGAQQPVYTRLRTAHRAGDLATALLLAEILESALEAEYGPLHPHTVNALTLRASLVLGRRTDWHEAVDVLVTTALRRRLAGARPEQDTDKAVDNAYAAWRVLAKEDPDRALATSGALAAMLADFGRHRRADGVLAWAENHRTGPHPG